MSQAEKAAIEPIEVTNVESAAQEIERRMDVSEQVQPVDDEAIETEQNLSPDEEVETETEETETSEETNELEQESEDQEPGNDEGENFSYENVAQLAEATGQSLEDFMANTMITRKIDGESEEVTLAEVVNGNQRDADYRRKTTDLADNRKAFEGEVNQAKAKLGQQFQEVAAMTTNLEQQLMGEFQGINWNELELNDREEWLVQRQKFGERQQQIETIKNQANQKLSEQQTEIQAKQQEYQQSLDEENTRQLLVNIPEWNDVEVWEKDDKIIRDFLSEYGYTEKELSTRIDHRLIRLVRDATLSKGKASQIDIAKKLVKKLPKIVKPGSKPDKGVIQRKEKNDKLSNFKKKARHSNQDVAALLLDRM
jgi:hypothetical protein